MLLPRHADGQRVPSTGAYCSSPFSSSARCLEMHVLRPMRCELPHGGDCGRCPTKNVQPTIRALYRVRTLYVGLRKAASVDDGTCARLSTPLSQLVLADYAIRAGRFADFLEALAATWIKAGKRRCSAVQILSSKVIKKPGAVRSRQFLDIKFLILNKQMLHCFLEDRQTATSYSITGKSAMASSIFSCG